MMTGELKSGFNEVRLPSTITTGLYTHFLSYNVECLFNDESGEKEKEEKKLLCNERKIRLWL